MKIRLKVDGQEIEVNDSVKLEIAWIGEDETDTLSYDFGKTDLDFRLVNIANTPLYASKRPYNELVSDLLMVLAEQAAEAAADAEEEDGPEEPEDPNAKDKLYIFATGDPEDSSFAAGVRATCLAKAQDMLREAMDDIEEPGPVEGVLLLAMFPHLWLRARLTEEDIANKDNWEEET